MDERTPKPSTVRTSWVKSHPFPLTTEVEEREAEFDRMIAAVERAAAVKALREASDAIVADIPYGFGMRPDGTEDKEMSAYAEGLHVANVTVSTYADRIESGE